MNELIQLSPVFKERDTRGLRNLYDSCEAHNRALKALGVNEESYSSIVVPVIVEKLPESFRLTITRGTDFLQWSMEQMLDAFVKELELREAHNAVGTTAIVNMEPISFPEHARSQVKGGHSSGEIELIHVGFPT